MSETCAMCDESGTLQSNSLRMTTGNGRVDVLLCETCRSHVRTAVDTNHDGECAVCGCIGIPRNKGGIAVYTVLFSERGESVPICASCRRTIQFGDGVVHQDEQ